MPRTWQGEVAVTVVVVVAKHFVKCVHDGSRDGRMAECLTGLGFEALLASETDLCTDEM